MEQNSVEWEEICRFDGCEFNPFNTALYFSSTVVAAIRETGFLRYPFKALDFIFQLNVPVIKNLLPYGTTFRSRKGDLTVHTSGNYDVSIFKFIVRPFIQVPTCPISSNYRSTYLPGDHQGLEQLCGERVKEKIYEENDCQAIQSGQSEFYVKGRCLKKEAATFLVAYQNKTNYRTVLSSCNCTCLGRWSRTDNSVFIRFIIYWSYAISSDIY